MLFRKFVQSPLSCMEASDITSGRGNVPSDSKRGSNRAALKCTPKGGEHAQMMIASDVLFCCRSGVMKGEQRAYQPSNEKQLSHHKSIFRQFLFCYKGSSFFCFYSPISCLIWSTLYFALILTLPGLSSATCALMMVKVFLSLNLILICCPRICSNGDAMSGAPVHKNSSTCTTSNSYSELRLHK